MIRAFALLGFVASCAHPVPPAPQPAHAVTPPATKPVVALALAVREQVVDANGVKLFARIVGGRAGGPALVLVHGGPGLSHEYMRPLERLATADYAVVSYDQRNAGRSSAAPDNLISSHARDLEALRTKLAIGDIDLVGHSWGGVVAMAYAAGFPEHLHSLIFVDSLAPTHGDTMGGFFHFSQKQRELERQGLIPKDVPDAVNNDCSKSLLAILPVYYFDPHHQATKDLAGSSCNEKTGSDTWDENRGYDLRRQLGSVTAPTLILQGDSDPFSKQMPEAIAHAMNDAAASVTLPACGHLPWEECPDALFEVLDIFLSAHLEPPTPAQIAACTGKACAQIGHRYLKGFGVAKDVAQALASFQRGCTQADPESCRWAGAMTMLGMGTHDDQPKALALIERACELGQPESCGLVGDSWAEGVPTKDPVKAKAFHEKACTLGDGSACLHLGNGYDEAGDPKKALASFQRSCDLREAGGCTNAGNVYARGEHVTKDVPRAVGLFDKACRLGDKTGCTNLDIVKSQLEP